MFFFLQSSSHSSLLTPKRFIYHFYHIVLFSNHTQHSNFQQMFHFCHSCNNNKLMLAINTSQCLLFFFQHLANLSFSPPVPQSPYRGMGQNFPLSESLLITQPIISSAKTKWDRKWNKCSAAVENEWLLIEATAARCLWRPFTSLFHHSDAVSA